MAIHRQAAQSGFSLIAAIFLLVVMAALGTYMLSFSAVQHTTSAQDLEGSRAYQAARAGIEWGLYQVLTTASAPAVTACQTSALSGLGGSLAAFNIEVSCSRTDYVEAGVTVSVYRITSRARSGTVGTTYFIERELEATVSR